MFEKGLALVLITAFALASTGSSQDNDIGEGLFIDGPGGYLPGVEDDADSSMNFDQTPSFDDGGFTNRLIIFGDLFNILNFWESYLRIFLG